MLKIVQAPHPVLSQVAAPITKIDKTIHTLIAEMTETLEAARDPEGVGLAAPQVGKSLRLFIVKESPKKAVKVFINPTVQLLSPIEREKPKHKKSADEDDDEGLKLEGCLSLKDIWGIVQRSPKVKVTYQDEHSKEHNEEITGFLATIMQHEFDHINGELFTKRVLEQKEKLYHSSKDKKGEIMFEEIKI